MTNKTDSITHWPIDRPIPYHRNPRKINEQAVSAVAGSIKEFGFHSPIIVDGAGVVIAGHTRLQAARSLHLTTVPVVIVTDLTPDQVAAYRLADNRVAEFSEWAPSLLGTELRSIKDVDLGFADFNALEVELAKLAAPSVEPMEDGDVEAVPDLPQAAQSKPGEVYLLGQHRLMCGDSTSSDAWQTLLGGEIGDAVMTDPPYGVNYVGKTKDALLVQNDDPEGLPVLLDGALGRVLDHCKPGGAWYVAGPSRPLSLVFENWLNAKGIFRQTLIWVKDSMVLGHSDYHYKHEPIFYGWKPGAPHRAPPDRTQVSVWEIPRPKRSAEHPTMKPVALYERMMLNSTAPGAIILEPFAGSGTTLIAAGKTGRMCRAIEISPQYCDVIRRRWTKFAKENQTDPGPGFLE